MNINLFFCEGPHDTAFLIRLLKDNGFNDYSDFKIISIPDKDISKIIAGSLKSFTYDDQRNLQQKPNIPSILSFNNDYVLLYSTGGHIYKHKDNPDIDTFLKTINLFNSIKESGIFSEKIESIKISLLYDADEGVEEKLKLMNKYVKNIEYFVHAEDLTHGNIQSLSNFSSLGCYLFTGVDEVTGNLEDILIEILNENNEKALTDSRIFISKNRVNGQNDTKDFNEQKALIGIVGQLEKSGMGNAPIISQTTLFKNKLTTKACSNLYQFITTTLANNNSTAS